MIPFTVAARLLCPWGYSRQEYWSGLPPSQPSNRTQVSRIAGRLFCGLSHKGSPRILEWVAYPFSRGSFQSRNQPGVSCITGGFFYQLSHFNRALFQSAFELGEVWRHIQNFMRLSQPVVIKIFFSVLLECKQGTTCLKEIKLTQKSEVHI